MADGQTNTDNKKYLDLDGLLYVKGKIKEQLDTKVDAVSGKGLSTNDLTDELKQKILNAGDSTFSGAYSDLTGRPSINGVELASGANTLAALGIQGAEDGKGLSTNDYTTAEKTKLAGIAEGANKTTVDSELSSTSTNPVQNKIVNAALGDKVDKETGKVLSTNDYTTADKNKLGGIASGAQVNVIESIKVNNTVLTISDKAVNITIPTNNNQLTNGAGYQTASDVETKINALIGAAPAALDTLKEIADAINNDADFAGTITTQLANKVNKSDLVAITNAEIDAIWEE